LRYNAHCEAACPYGKTIRAFLVVEDWLIGRLLTLIDVALVLTICVFAVATAISHNIEMGLTAGSYTGGLVAVLLAIFTFLSAVV
jgi:uncharacterized metal-binding protein